MTDRTLDLWRELRPLNPASGVVIQAALRRSPADVEALIAEGARVRLCKGAYNEPARSPCANGTRSPRPSRPRRDG